MFFRFLSSNFMKLCRNIHRSVWQLLGVEQIQNGGRCHGNQGANFFNSLQTSQSFVVMFPVTSTYKIQNGVTMETEVPK